MCGRFVESRPISDIVDFFGVDDVEVPEELTDPRWNIAPQAGVLAVTVRRPRPARDSDDRDGPLPSDPRPATRTSDGRQAEVAGDASGQHERRRLTSYRWGLVPSWAKDPRLAPHAFNARAESLLEKPAFRTALDRRRCLIPADAFYEWEKSSASGSAPASRSGGRPRQPWCYRTPDGSLMAFGGLWEAWKSRTAAAQDSAASGGSAPAAGDPRSSAGDLAADGWHDDWLLTCTIITTPANETVSPVHDRMPLVLEPSDWEAWLHAGPLAADDLASMLRTPRVGLLEAYEVSSEVNTSSAEGPQLVEPKTDIEPTLF